MKNEIKGKEIITTFAIMLMLGGILFGGAVFIPKAHAQPPPYLTVVPSSLTEQHLSFPPGSTFNISIEVVDVTNLFAFQCGFYFNSSVLEVTNVWEGGFLSKAAGGLGNLTPYPPLTSPPYTTGMVPYFGWSERGNLITSGVSKYASGTGFLMNATLEVIASAPPYTDGFPGGPIQDVGLITVPETDPAATVLLSTTSLNDVTPPESACTNGTFTETVTPNTYLVVRGADDRVYYRAYNSTTASWAAWNVVPTGATPDSPAAAVYSGTLYIVVRGEDNRSLWFGSVNLTNNSFSGWTLLSGATPSAPTLVTYGARLCLIVRGLDNSIYCRFYAIVPQTWASWEVVPSGSTPDGPAAATLGNQLYIVVGGMDGSSMWQGSLINSTSSFSGWTLVTGATPSAPALASYQAGSLLDLMVRGEDNGIYHGFWNASVWEGWALLPGATLDRPGVTVVSGTLQVTVRGMDGSSIWFGTVDLTTKAFSGWTLVSGATPSAPTLAS